MNNLSGSYLSRDKERDGAELGTWGILEFFQR